MNEQASFSLRGRNPDVLTCIANLSNDEVFTPPEFANRMLDTLGRSVGCRPRRREHLGRQDGEVSRPVHEVGRVPARDHQPPHPRAGERDSEPAKRVDHILTKQVFGIGITHLTSLLARRSVYCSKHAKGEHSIAKSFAQRRRQYLVQAHRSTRG